MTGKMRLDTRPGSQYFRLEISGKLSILSVLTLSGAVIVEVSTKAWSITIPSTNKLGRDARPAEPVRLGHDPLGRVHSTSTSAAAST